MNAFGIWKTIIPHTGLKGALKEWMEFTVTDVVNDMCYREWLFWKF